MQEVEPRAMDWDWLDALAGPIDEDFLLAIAEKLEEQEHPALDFFE